MTPHVGTAPALPFPIMVDCDSHSHGREDIGKKGWLGRASTATAGDASRCSRCREWKERRTVRRTDFPMSEHGVWNGNCCQTMVTYQPSLSRWVVRVDRSKFCLRQPQTARLGETPSRLLNGLAVRLRGLVSSQAHGVNWLSVTSGWCLRPTCACVPFSCQPPH